MYLIVTTSKAPVPSSVALVSTTTGVRSQDTLHKSIVQGPIFPTELDAKDQHGMATFWFLQLWSFHVLPG